MGKQDSLSAETKETEITVPKLDSSPLSQSTRFFHTATVHSFIQALRDAHLYGNNYRTTKLH